MCNYVAYNRFYKRRFLHLFTVKIKLLVTEWVNVSGSPAIL